MSIQKKTVIFSQSTENLFTVIAQKHVNFRDENVTAIILSVIKLAYM